jgi:hypothetical protein
MFRSVELERHPSFAGALKHCRHLVTIPSSHCAVTERVMESLMKLRNFEPCFLESLWQSGRIGLHRLPVRVLLIHQSTALCLMMRSSIARLPAT